MIAPFGRGRNVRRARAFAGALEKKNERVRLALDPLVCCCLKKLLTTARAILVVILRPLLAFASRFRRATGLRATAGVSAGAGLRGVAFGGVAGIALIALLFFVGHDAVFLSGCLLKGGRLGSAIGIPRDVWTKRGDGLDDASNEMRGVVAHEGGSTRK